MSTRALDRFTLAQGEGEFETALAELQAGQKEGHWIWYVFPQIAGLGHSSTSQRYAIADLAEANAYLQDEVLGPRLVLISGVVAAELCAGARLAVLMGSRIDALKLVSSMTLFAIAAERLCASRPGGAFGALPRIANDILAAAEAQGFPRCRHTLERLARAGS